MSAPCPIFGATVHAQLRPDADASSLHQRFQNLLASRGLVGAGSGGTVWNFVVSSEAGQMTEGDRQAVLGWLEAEPGVENARVTELGDVR